MDIFGMGPMEMMLILLVALLIFGPGRLPEIGAGLGRAIREFRRMTSDLTGEFTKLTDEITEEVKKETEGIAGTNSPAAATPQPVQTSTYPVVPATPVTIDNAFPDTNAATSSTMSESTETVLAVEVAPVVDNEPSPNGTDQAGAVSGLVAAEPTAVKRRRSRKTRKDGVTTNGTDRPAETADGLEAGSQPADIAEALGSTQVETAADLSPVTNGDAKPRRTRKPSRVNGERAGVPAEVPEASVQEAVTAVPKAVAAVPEAIAAVPEAVATVEETASSGASKPKRTRRPKANGAEPSEV